MTDPGAQVGAVVVAYRPDSSALDSLLAALRDQVERIVVVDNGAGEGMPVELASAAGVELLCPTSNLGVAAAQNLGIARVRDLGCRHVLILDHDSLPAPHMVASLLAAMEQLATDHPVAAVAPRFHELHQNREAPFVRLGFPLNRRLWCRPGQSAVAVDFLISSGSLIPLDVLDAVGLMGAGLFIDNVDLEWCFRAKAMGYELFGVCAATMHHRLGDARRRLPLGMGSVAVHAPVRLYYMMRNRVRLYRMRHTPFIWVLQDLPRVLVKLFLFAVMIGPRLRNLHFMLRGLHDGVRGRQGRCPEDLI